MWGGNVDTILTEFIQPLNKSAPKTSNGVDIQKIFDNITDLLNGLRDHPNSVKSSTMSLSEDPSTSSLDALRTPPRSSATSFTLSLSDGREFYKAIKPFLPSMPDIGLPPPITATPVDKLNILTFYIMNSAVSLFIPGDMQKSLKSILPMMYNIEAFAHNMIGLS